MKLIKTHSVDRKKRERRRKTLKMTLPTLFEKRQTNFPKTFFNEFINLCYVDRS